ncbi:MAG: hypothetical protein H6601_03975 [Flavobacteriales bacterium]|nr:hypothetical protein [Flavobacteriales bacterium]
MMKYGYLSMLSLALFVFGCNQNDDDGTSSCTNEAEMYFSAETDLFGSFSPTTNASSIVHAFNQTDGTTTEGALELSVDNDNDASTAELTVAVGGAPFVVATGSFTKEDFDEIAIVVTETGRYDSVQVFNLTIDELGSAIDVLGVQSIYHKASGSFTATAANTSGQVINITGSFCMDY